MGHAISRPDFSSQDGIGTALFTLMCSWPSHCAHTVTIACPCAVPAPGFGLTAYALNKKRPGTSLLRGASKANS